MRNRLFCQALAALLISATTLTACNSSPNVAVEENGAISSDQATDIGDRADKNVLVIGAIPDQDPEKLNRLYDKLTSYLAEELDVEVQYKQMTNYPAAVSAFKVGDLDLVWFGGLTGVQARLQVEGAEAIAQRDIDDEFTSVFIANTSSGIEPFDSVEGLTAIKDRRLTFGSESSTSGRLMPQHFMEQAGVTLEDLQGQPGFSGSHDTILEVVQAGSYEVGAMNEQVWSSRLEEGKVDESKVQVIFQTPAYYNYHWILQPSVDERFGEGFSEKVQQAFLALDASDADQAEILDLFGAESFIATENANYNAIETVGRAVGKIK